MCHNVFMESYERKNKILFTLGTVGLIIITLILFIAFLIQSPPPVTQPKISRTIPTVFPTTPPTSTQLPLVKSEITFEVLNGSGRNGAAAAAAKSLSGLGYTNTTTGNADKVYDTTQISLSPNISEHRNEIINEIKTLFPSLTVVKELPDSTSSAALIIGRN